MLTVKYDAVLIIIHVWRILEAPLAVIDRDWNNPVIIACRMIGSSGIAYILHAEQAFRITALFCQFCRSNGFWIFLWFG